MISEQYVWLLWSSAFLIPWIGVYLAFPAHRKAMLWASLFTTPFGFTEPLFVPEYWSPPSLFDLAITTGFDIESLIFVFGIGGISSTLYNLVTGQVPNKVSSKEKHAPLHRHHYKALSAPFIVFLVIYWFPWNPIYPGIVAMFIGAIANMLCRPDLKKKTWIGGLLFLGYYMIFLTGLELTAPGYIDKVWNLEALSGLSLFYMPVEELLFAITFGMYWSGVYEHFTWHKE
jgi:Lycopene cyclase